MLKFIEKGFLKEFTFTDNSIEIETLYNNGAELDSKHKDLLHRYTQVEHLYNNITASISKEQADKIRAEYKRLKAEVEKAGLLDLNKDNRITTISKYINSKDYSSKAYNYMEVLGLVKNKKVTDIGKWFANQLVKYPNFRAVAIDDNNIDAIKDTLQSLYNNKIEIKSNSVFNSELDNIKSVNTTRKDIKNKVTSYIPDNDKSRAEFYRRFKNRK